MSLKSTVRTTIAVLLCLLLISGCSLLDRGVQSSPQRLAEAYLEAFKNSDYDTMLSLCLPGDETPEELEFTRKFVQMIELTAYSVGPVERLSDEEAQVEVTLTLVLMDYERTETDRIRVVKADGKWYITDYLQPLTGAFGSHE
ncbi:MAG: hypothetical protein AB1767_12770 [Bacillota bacterium]